MFSEMTRQSWIMFYCAGMLLGVMEFFCIGRKCLKTPLRKWIGGFVTICLWPVLLPLSFAALFTTICYWLLKLMLWSFDKMGGGFYINGKRVMLTYAS